MRITGGRARGIPIKVPRGDVTRPATDRMREAVFSSLGDQVEGSHVVDLFAGTGAYGLEAVSRGAVQATFYEINRSALMCLKQNKAAVLKACELETDVATIIARDVYASETVSRKADLVFIDPPYDEIESKIDIIFEKAARHAASDAFVVLELPGDLKPEPDGWQVVRRFGKPKRDAPNAMIFERQGISNAEKLKV